MHPTSARVTLEYVPRHPYGLATYYSLSFFLDRCIRRALGDKQRDRSVVLSGWRVSNIDTKMHNFLNMLSAQPESHQHHQVARPMVLHSSLRHHVKLYRR